MTGNVRYINMSTKEKTGKMNSKKIVSVVGYCFLLISLQVLNVRAWEHYLGESSQFGNAYYSTKTLIIIIAVVTIIFLLKKWIDLDVSVLKRPPSIKKELMVAGIMSVILIVGIIVIRLVAQNFMPQMAERPFFGWYFMYHTRWFYPISSFLQEAFIRLIIQDNLRKLEDETTKNASLFITALFFCSLHMAYPWYMMLGTALYCLITGYLYNKYKCVYALSIIHFVAGFFPRCFGLV